MLEISAWSESFVERRVNAKGSNPENGSQVFLSFISRVTVAASPSLSDDLETSCMVTSFCVIKCVAISLKFPNSSVNSLFTEPCETTTGIVGTVGVVGTTGVVGITGTVGGITGVVGVVGITGCIGVTTVGTTGTVHVFTIGTVGTVSTTGSVGIFVLLL